MSGEQERSRLVVRAGVVGMGTLLSRVLGLGRDMALAAAFTRDATDAFFVAFTIPNALRQLLGEGAVSSAVVPVLAGTLEREGDDGARRFFARVRGASLLALAIVTILGVAFARPLAVLFAGGYRDRPEQFERVVTMTRLVFPYILFMGTAALGMAALNVKRRFAVAAFAPGLLNVAFLAAAFVLPPILAARGVDVAHAIVIGALVGGALQVVAQWPSLLRIGYAARPVLDLRDPGVREVFRRIAPLGFGIGVYYVDLVLSRRFLSELGPGAQSYFTWASRVCDFPQGIFVMALSTASLPSLATFAARGETGELARTAAHALRLALFVALPASAFLAVLAEPLVALLFQRGHFDAFAAHETARALVWQGGAIWTVAIVRQLVPVFHALGDVRTPVVVSAIDLVAFIVLAVALRGPMGHAGISVAVAGSSAVQMALLAVLLRRKLGPAAAALEVTGSVARTAAASFGGAAAAVGVAAITPRAAYVGMPAILGGLAFGFGFVAIAAALRSPELTLLTGGARRRLGRVRAR